MSIASSQPAEHSPPSSVGYEMDEELSPGDGESMSDASSLNEEGQGRLLSEVHTSGSIESFTDQNAEDRSSLGTGSSTSYPRSEDLQIITSNNSSLSRGISSARLNIGTVSTSNSNSSTTTRNEAQSASRVDRLCKVFYFIVN